MRSRKTARSSKIQYKTARSLETGDLAFSVSGEDGMNKKRCKALLPCFLSCPARTVPVLAAVPERLTTVVEQPVEAQSWEVDAVSGATLTAEGQISVGGIGHCARACGCRYWQRRCSSSCWAAGWVSAGLSEPKRRLPHGICAAASFWLG